MRMLRANGLTCACEVTNILSSPLSMCTFEYVTTIIDDIHYVKPLIVLMKFLGQACRRPTWILREQHFGDPLRRLL